MSFLFRIFSLFFLFTLLSGCFFKRFFHKNLQNQSEKADEKRLFDGPDLEKIFRKKGPIDSGSIDLDEMDEEFMVVEPLTLQTDIDFQSSQEEAWQFPEDKEGHSSNKNIIYFGFDSSTPVEESKRVIAYHASRLQGNKRKIQLVGHADERGSQEYNLALGQRRAERVRQEFSALGVDKKRIEATSYGEEKPRAFGKNEESWAKNRRVEIYEIQQN